MLARVSQLLAELLVLALKVYECVERKLMLLRGPLLRPVQLAHQLFRLECLRLQLLCELTVLGLFDF